MRTNAAYPFHQVKVLRPGSALRAFFHAAVNKAQPGSGVGDNFSFHGKFKMTGFF
jgi:hypothetical protein